MSEAVEYGVIKFYKEDKKFGFVTVLDASGAPTSTELFFHYNNGFFLRAGSDAPEFRFENGSVVDNKGIKYLKIPEKGDKIVFIRGRNAKGEKVAKWGQANQYDALVTWIANRPVYRVVKYATNYGVSSESYPWTGQNTMVLSARHPKRVRPGGRVTDDLVGGSADSGDMYWHYDIERQLDDGSWTSCKDPRVFLCCVPPDIYRKHCSYTIRQDPCYHAPRAR